MVHPFNVSVNSCTKDMDVRSVRLTFRYPLLLCVCFRDDINRAYRKLAVLIHPDKSLAPGTEDAFKALVNARAALLQNHR